MVESFRRGPKDRAFFLLLRRRIPSPGDGCRQTARTPGWT